MAVDRKIDDQAEFVRWWKETVPNRGDNRKNAQTAAFSESDAESLTGITHQQVSRWSKSLKDLETYRARLFGKAYAAAMAMAYDQDRARRAA